MQRGWSPRSGSGFSPFLKITAQVKHIPSPLHWDLGLIQTEAQQRRHRFQQITGTSEAIAFKCPLCHRDKSPLVLRLACMQGGYLGGGSRAPPRPLSIPVHGRCVPPSPCLVSISVWDLHQHLGQQAHPARMLPNQHPGPAQPRQGGTNLGSVFLLPEMSEGCRGREVTAP